MDVKCGCFWRCEKTIQIEVSCTTCGVAKYCMQSCREKNEINGGINQNVKIGDQRNAQTVMFPGSYKRYVFFFLLMSGVCVGSGSRRCVCVCVCVGVCGASHIGLAVGLWL